MIATGWLVAVLLAAAATAVGWPVHSSRARRRRVLGAPKARPGTAEGLTDEHDNPRRPRR